MVTMLKFLLGTVLTGAVLFVLLLIVLYTQQRRFLFPAPNIYLSPEAMGVPNMVEVELDTDVGQLTAWWSPPRAGCRSAVMVFHGNGSAVFSNVDVFRDLMGAGYGVWSAAYPGYPGSAGEASEASLTRAAVIQFDMVRETMGQDGHVHVYGTSIGTGVAAQLSRLRRPDSLFLDAPFYSASDVVKANLWWLPVDRLMKDPFRSHEALKDVDIPLYWSHGTKDTIIPLYHGQRLYDEYRGPKRFVTIDGGDHVNLWGKGAREFVMSALATPQGDPSKLPLTCPGSG